MKNLGLFDKRVGRFVISKKFIELLDSNSINELFSNMLIVRAEYLYHMDAIDYVAYSKYFQVVEEGDTIPSYDAVIDENQFLGWIKL